MIPYPDRFTPDLSRNFPYICTVVFNLRATQLNIMRYVHSTNKSILPNPEPYEPTMNIHTYTPQQYIPTSLQLSLLGLSSQVGHQHIPQFTSRLVQVVAHTLGADALADDVEVEAEPTVSLLFLLTVDV